MSRVQVTIDGTKYDIDADSEEELINYLGMNAEFQKKKRFQFAQKVISGAVPVMKKGIGFLAAATTKAASVEHTHDDHREPHYEDSFERSKEHQLNKEAECIDRFNEGIDIHYGRMENIEEGHNAFNDYFTNHMDELYERKREMKKIKLKKRKLRKTLGIDE